MKRKAFWMGWAVVLCAASLGAARRNRAHFSLKRDVVVLTVGPAYLLFCVACSVFITGPDQILDRPMTAGVKKIYLPQSASAIMLCGSLLARRRTSGTVADVDHGPRSPRMGLLAVRVDISHPHPPD